MGKARVGGCGYALTSCCAAGTMPYMSPELIAHARLTQLNDVYSFGIVMWQLFTGEVGLNK